MAHLKFKIKFVLNDQTGEVEKVRLEHRGSSYVDYPNKTTIADFNSLNEALKEATHEMLVVKDLDFDFNDQCMPIAIYSRNPTCVRVGGWLFCP